MKNVVKAGALALAVLTAPFAQAAEPTKVTLVSSTVNPPSLTNIYYLGAIAGGYMTKNGLDVQLQQSTGSPSSLAAIVSGRTEFASINMAVLANAVSEGVKAHVVIVGNMDAPGMIITQPEITSLKQIEGKTLGSSAVGSSEYNHIVAYLPKHGVDVKKINWVATGNSGNTIQAMVAKRLDGAFLHVSDALAARKLSSSLRFLVDAHDFAKEVQIVGAIVVVTDDYAKAHPDTVSAFVTAILEGNRRLYNDRAFFDMVVEKYMPGIYTPDDKKFLYDSYRDSWGVNGGMVTSVLDQAFTTWKTDINPKGANSPYLKTTSDLFNQTFVAKALDKLGVEPGSVDAADWYKKK